MMSKAVILRKYLVTSCCPWHKIHSPRFPSSFLFASLMLPPMPSSPSCTYSHPLSVSHALQPPIPSLPSLPISSPPLLSRLLLQSTVSVTHLLPCSLAISQPVQTPKPRQTDRDRETDTWWLLIPLSFYLILQWPLNWAYSEEKNSPLSLF